MGKNKIGILCVFWLACSISVFSQNINRRVAEIYTAEIGVREKTGNNDGERVEEYLRVCGLGKGYAWCAAFISWTFDKAGVKAIKSAWSPNWFPANKTIYVRGNKNNLTPNRADVLGITRTNGSVYHVGFIDEWTNGSNFCISVEGNTNNAGSAEGDGVYKKRRLKSQIGKVSRWI